MSSVFQLIQQQSSSILTRNKCLKKRLHNIRRIRNNDHKIAYKDKTPLLSDITRTHINFIESSYKPFVSIGYEYTVVHPRTLNTKLGDTVQFSIPAFGDFFSDMAFHCVVKAPKVTLDDKIKKNYPSVRWADYPGERLMKNTGLITNGEPLDEYTSDDIVMYRQFKVPNHKLDGWKRNVGQQIPMDGYIDDDFQEHAPGHRVHMNCCNGLQTPKDAAEWNTASDADGRPNDLEVFVPLLFWFNTDYRNAIASVSIPYGQRFIEITLEKQSRLFNWQQRGGPWADSDITIEDAVIQKVELYINNLFVSPEIHNIYIRKMGHLLIRIHAKQVVLVNNQTKDIPLNQIYGAIENLFIGARPINLSDDLHSWHLFSHIKRREFTIPGLGPGSFKVICHEQIPPIHTLQVKFSTIDWGPYSNYPSQLYNSYIPYVYGGYNINTPTDRGLLMVNFCLNPGTHQPSGHIITDDKNYIILDFATSFDNFNPAKLIVSGSCLVTLSVEDGRCEIHHIKK